MALSFMSESRRLVNTRLVRELRVRLRYPRVHDGLLAGPGRFGLSRRRCMNILLLTHPMPAAPFAAAIRALAPDHALIEYRPDLDAATLAEIDVVLGWQMPRGVAAKMPKLRWVCAVAAGVDKLLVEDLAEGVPVSRIVDVEQAEGIAQFVVMMALRQRARCRSTRRSSASASGSATRSPRCAARSRCSAPARWAAWSCACSARSASRRAAGAGPRPSRSNRCSARATSWSVRCR
jgi:hypothetical protein